eukprot:4221342-Pyramimonas_sp.AAC.1
MSYETEGDAIIPQDERASRPPQVIRTPLQRSLPDDVPHGVRGRSEVMRRRLAVGGSASPAGRAQGDASSGSAPGPRPEPVSPLLEAWHRT